MNFLINYLKIPIAVFQTVVILFTCLFTHYSLNFHPRAVIGTTILASVLVMMLNPNDTYVKGTPERMNMDFYQEMDGLIDKAKQGSSLMHLLFGARKVLNSCLEDPKSNMCFQDLKQLEQTKNISMNALVEVMNNPKIVKPQNVQIYEYNHEASNEPGSIKTDSFKVETIHFEQTISKVVTTTATRQELNKYEMNVCALAALRLQHGIEYYWKFKDHIAAQERAYASVEGFVSWVLFLGPLDNVLLKSYAGDWNKLKVVAVGIFHVFKHIFYRGEVTMEEFMKNTKEWNLTKTVDVCAIDRCLTANPMMWPTRQDKNVAKKGKAETAVNVSLPVRKYDCPSGDYDFAFDFTECAILKDKCFSAIDLYNLKQGDYDKLCPTTCQRILVQAQQAEQYIVGVHAEGNSSFVDRNSTKVHESCHASPKKCITFSCHASEFVSNIEDLLIKTSLGSILIVSHAIFKNRNL